MKSATPTASSTCNADLAALVCGAALEWFAPKRWLYFSYAHQIAQAAVSGQGVALARMPLIADSLASGALVEAMPTRRMDSPMAYWLIVGPRNNARPEVTGFCDWLKGQAAQT